ncbi:flippase-like domain-containing protein [Candidatus Saccharibacteria bacterium]|nr:flippase-like domain-containing protein [Candidatus Saccharibacteria bacterium]
MTIKTSTLKRYIPLILGIALLVGAALYVPWDSVEPYLAKVSALNYSLLILLSVLYYFGRSLRYWLMLKMLHQTAPFKIVVLSCLAAQPIAVLPGGELYRGVMLKRYGNVNLSDSTASVFAQSLAESFGLIVIALIGAGILHRYELATASIAIVLFAMWIVINLYSGSKAHRVTNLLPGVNFHPSSVAAYLRRNRILLSGKNFGILLAASLVSTVAGIAMVITVIYGLGLHIGIAQAAMVYALPAVLEVVSFLPGGLGANEGTSVGLLLLFNFSLPEAIAVTILVRIFTLGIGFIFGFGAMLWAKIGNFRQYD